MSKLENPTWQSIQREVSRRIAERIWQPGEQIPNEADLAQEFGCARATVNRAMRELASTGLLERRRKAGTRVALNPVRKATLEISITRQEVERRGAQYRHVVLKNSLEMPPLLISSQMGLPVETKLRHIKTLHLADNQPFMYEDRWINPKAVPDLPNADLGQISVNEWLVQNAPFSEGDISFSAINAANAEAGHLGIATGTAIFSIERMTKINVTAITLVKLFYMPGFKMHTTI